MGTGLKRRRGMFQGHHISCRPVLSTHEPAHGAEGCLLPLQMHGRLRNQGAPVVNGDVGRLGELVDVDDAAAHKGLRVDRVLQALGHVDLQQLLHISTHTSRRLARPCKEQRFVSVSCRCWIMSIDACMGHAQSGPPLGCKKQMN